VWIATPIRSVAMRSVHIVEQPRQGLENCHLCACAGVDVTELERNYSATDKDYAGRQRAFAQHIV
jgi:hypothetical protein